MKYQYVVLLDGALPFGTNDHNQAYLYSRKSNAIVVDSEEGVVIQQDYSMLPLEEAPVIEGDAA